MFFFEVKSFTELEDYMDWLEAQAVYPIEFYINGTSYKLVDKKTHLAFCMGQETAFNIVDDIIK